MSLKTFYFSLFFLCSICFVTAQKDTVYLDANGVKVAPSLAMIYQVRTKVQKSQIETIEEYDAILDYKKRYYMLKKLPQWTIEEVVITGYEMVGGQRVASKKLPKAEKVLDSSMVKHGTYMEWYPSGAAKTRASYLNGRLNGTLETFYPNDKPKQIEEYHLDSLKKASCFDSLGTAIIHNPYFELPKFPNGASAFYKFLGQTIRYPKEAREQGLQETIFVSFTIDKTGSITKVKTLKSKFKYLSDESVRTVELIPKWTPAKLDGKANEMTFVIPFTFILE